MKLSQNAQRVLKTRYLLKDKNGKVIETPEQLFHRVSRTIASAETLYGGNPSVWERKFYALMTELRFLPNSPTLMNAGKEMGQLAACFVLPVKDSMDSIFNTLKNAALILQSGGGTGFSFSDLRPKADIVQSTGGIASGPVSFMKIYNTATEVIKQGGARRGANMGILRVDHPDILEFIRVKRKNNQFTNFNISVAVTDAFMEALTSHKTYNLINPRSGDTAGKIKADTVFDEIVESAWETGDPGIIFIDTINRANPTPHVGTMVSTNPCGEQPLLPFEACVLGSIDVSKYVTGSSPPVSKGKKKGGIERIDFTHLAEDIFTSVRFLDNAIDVNTYPVSEIEKMHKGNRKIGLGVMGWADTLIKLGIPYNDEQAFGLAQRLMKFVRDTSREASGNLADERGVFLNYKGSRYDTAGMPPLRNATTTTIAPTGTLSIIADCSSSIEPLFALAYKRYILNSEFYEMNKYFFRMARDAGFYNEALKEKVIEKGTLRGMKEVPGEIRRLFRTAHEIPFEDHIEMQACFQRYTDNAVSKTINMSHGTKKDDVAKAFLLAYRKECKGITIFRYGTALKGTMLKFSDVD